MSLKLPAVVIALGLAVPAFHSAAQPGAPAAGRSGMVSSAHPLATEAGLKILRSGGNAFDAAVAVAAALNVVEPEMSGMGGYGTILVYDAKSKKTWFLNPSGRIPAAVDSDAFRAPTPGYVENRRGAKSVSTPGNVHAWEAMSRRHGRLKWSRLFEPAIDLAANGFALESREADLIARGFAGFPEHARTIYGPHGKPLGAGERLVQTDLARSLGLVAKGGAAAFYEGELAGAIDGAMKEAGGFLSLADLARDEAEWRAPIAIRYRGVDVLTASPPANAFDYLVRLGLMQQFDVRALGHNSVEYLHRFAEATKHGFWVRLRYAGDPDVAPPPLDRLLSAAYWKEQAAAIDAAKAKPFVPPGVSGGADRHTTHFVVADKDGNIVSATQTLGGVFGSRIMPRGTGIWLNDSLEFSTFEPKGNPMDAHAGRRKLSGDCPTIILRNGRPWAALGTPGGHTIGQTVPQIVMNLVDFGMDVQEALAAPRVSFAEPDVLMVEEAIPVAVRTALASRGHNLRVTRGMGNAHALTIEFGPDGRIAGFKGAADPRGAGRAAGF
ncbi:MAG: gamma-glutamyltransferase [Acidobacteria bacterium RIFCSPLOWO2_02_FULL_67_36]|nr:MAG: gamma-glutamyltransferase [Acidobacteria bacterium RIFCSPLOWO2_02_FULL_67_36]